MRTAAAVVVLSAALSAQEPKPPVDWNGVAEKVAAINAALAARDIKKVYEAANAAWLFTGAEWRKQAPTPADYLRDAEASRALHPGSVNGLPRLASLACQAGQMDKAESYAREALAALPSLAAAVHTANNVLGIAALGRGDLAGARSCLMASTRITGNQILDRWGPNLALAKALLEKGQNDAVLAYFQACKLFVTKNPKLDDWIAMLKGGRAPDLSREYLWFY